MQQQQQQRTRELLYMFAAILMSKISNIELLTMYGKLSHLQLEIFLWP